MPNLTWFLLKINYLCMLFILQLMDTAGSTGKLKNE